MSGATWITGNTLDVLRRMPDQSVDMVMSSPPYWRQRSYLESTAVEKEHEIGQEPTPGLFLASLLQITDELHRIVKDSGTIWINLGDSMAGSGGAGGDYSDEGQRAGQNRFAGTNGARGDVPQAKATCWIPELFGASLAYGRNLLTGDACQQWVTRPSVTWCKTSVTPGRCDDRFRRATELIVWAAKGQTYWWDRAAILEPLADSPGNRYARKVSPTDALRRPPGMKDPIKDNRITADFDPPAEGAPPFNWWPITPSGWDGAHFATYPPELIVRPIKAACPPGGIVLDPFGGSGTTLAVATGHGRDAIGIDLDPRNLEIARDRVGPMFFTEATPDELWPTAEDAA